MCSESVHSPSPFWEEAMDSHNSPDRPCYFCAEETHVYDDCPWRPHPAVPSATAALHEGAKQPFAKAMGSESVGSSPTPPQQPNLFQEVAPTSGQMGPTAGQVNPIGVAAGYPEVECPCGRGTTVVRTSRTERNPGREFYTCPAMQISQKCGFFLWCDKVGVDPPFGVNSPVKSYQRCGSDSPVKLDQRHNFNSPVSPVRQYAFNTPVKPDWRMDINSPVKFEQQFSVNSPMCACGAGKCRLLIMQDGCDAGRKYFACTVKKGQGACNFFQWYDTAPTKSLEMKNDNLVYNEAPSFELAPEEAKEQRMDESDERDDGASELKPDLEGHEGKNGGPGEANDGTIQEGLQRPDAPVRSSSPPSCRDHKSNHAESDALLIKRLSLHESSPTKVTPRPGKCFRCGNDGHWMSECAAAYVCFKCGKYGHWKKDCTM